MSAQPSEVEQTSASPSADATLDVLTTALDAFTFAGKALRARTLERGTIIDDLLAAVVAGQHVALVGPPGVAKSQVVRHFAACFLDAAYFEYLLTRFTEPHEVMGALDVAAFKAGVSRRVTARMLPEAHLAFLDEAFKANSAILNSLLTLLNERLYHNGGEVLDAPLQTAVLASNELPAADCAALWDRCLIRHVVRPLQHDVSRLSLVRGDMPAEPVTATISLVEHVTPLREHAAGIAGAISVEVGKALIKLAAELGSKGVEVSDRRLSQLRGYLGAVAALNGDTEITDEHFARLAPLLWVRPEQIPTVEAVLANYASSWNKALRDHRAMLATLQHEWTTLKAAVAAGRKDAALAARILKDTRGCHGSAHKQLGKQTHRPEVAGFLSELQTLLDDIKGNINAMVN